MLLHITHTKITVASVIRLNIKALMHCEAFSSDDHNNDKERNYAKQNAIYTSLDNYFFFMSVTLIKGFPVELLPALLFSETANIDIT